MNERRGGLGRGLAALIPSGPTDLDEDGQASTPDRYAEPAPRLRSSPPPPSEPAEEPVSRETGEGVAGAVYREIPTESISPNPRQPRQVFDEEALAELEHSVSEFGLMQPIVVRELEDDVAGFELIMGERRWRACQRAGLERIPAIVRQTQDDALLRDALLENIHRVQLNPLEEASAYQQLLDEFEVTHDELAERIGRSRPVITNTIRLLRLPMAVQRRVAAGVLSAGHARALLTMDDPDGQEELAGRIIAEGLSVRATEEAVTLKKGEQPPEKKKSPTRKSADDPQVQEVAEWLADRLDTKVKVDFGQRKGRIVVEFGSVDDLRRISDLMSPTRGSEDQ